MVRSSNISIHVLRFYIVVIYFYNFDLDEGEIDKEQFVVIFVFIIFPGSRD